MAIRMAIANHKGGVAKFTTVLMVAEGLALFQGLRVLVVDMDPQSSVSSMLLSAQGADAAAAKGRSLSHLLAQLADGQAIQLSKLLALTHDDVHVPAALAGERLPQR